MNGHEGSGDCKCSTVVARGNYVWQEKDKWTFGAFSIEGKEGFSMGEVWIDLWDSENEPAEKFLKTKQKITHK